MKHQSERFDEAHVLHELKHYLPAQNPLKDFIHHNSLHAFQHQSFFFAIQNARQILGYKTSYSLQEYRGKYAAGEIHDSIINRCIDKRHGLEKRAIWKERMFQLKDDGYSTARIGRVRASWKSRYKIDLDALVHVNLFRILNSYLDQGIAIWQFPVHNKGFLESLRIMETNSYSSFFKSKRAKSLFLSGKADIRSLLQILIEKESLFEHYLFDQQFAHPGWSGLVSVIEDNPGSLIVSKKISLKELIILELLLEIDALDNYLGNKWTALGQYINEPDTALFAPVLRDESSECIQLWQESLEWSYFDQVLAGISKKPIDKSVPNEASFQAVFCIDDRNCSIRRYLENLDPHCKTFGTPGHFGLDFYFQPENSNSYTKVCPAPVQPNYLIRETGSSIRHKKDHHFNKFTHHFFFGWLIAQTLGFWAAFKLFIQIFKPAIGPATASSFRHMDKHSELSIEHKHQHRQHHLQVGYTLEEMADRVSNVLHSIGLIESFAPIVYIIGHGASSVNNTHYAGYDCGACSGRPGSVNAKAFAHMANHPGVRKLLTGRNIHITDSTRFISGLHDTTRDEIEFFEKNPFSDTHQSKHSTNAKLFEEALQLNAKERSRRFESINTSLSKEKIHEKIKKRSVSLFEPRPELNHATNALCIVGRRQSSKHVFLDRRAFMNSYDYRIDPEGKYLLTILNAAAPVCGGINLEYYFSRVDNQKLGAGSKLPHNVMGLIGVSNGIEGDLRPGLPLQMIEVHDPLRLLIIVEHQKEVVLNVIQKNPATYEWFKNDWIKLVVQDPENGGTWLFENGNFSPYFSITTMLPTMNSIDEIIGSGKENIPVYLIPELA